MLLLLTFFLGLAAGSFLNVVIYWLPRNQKTAHPPSSCPSCRKGPGLGDLIPVLSRLRFRGCCAYCGAKIPWRYTLTQLVNAAAWVLIIWQWGMTLQGVVGLFLFSLSLVIAQIDLDHYLIPNSLVLLCLAGGVVYHFLAGDLSIANRIAGLATGFAVPFLLAVLSKGGLGGGDVKLMAALGVWLGFQAVLYALFAGALAGSIAGLALIISGRKKRKDPIPFGPFLVLGFLVIFFYQ